MLLDIVVDTNVFMHADNFQEPRCTDAISFLLSLQASETRLCVDEGFDTNEAKNRSHLGSEYLNNLNINMLGFAVVSHLAKTGRLREVSRKVPTQISKKIRRRVGSNRDTVFVRVAFNSQDKTLASHDFTHMPQNSRDKLSRTISVHIVSADEAQLELE